MLPRESRRSANAFFAADVHSVSALNGQKRRLYSGHANANDGNDADDGNDVDDRMGVNDANDANEGKEDNHVAGQYDPS